MAKKFKADAADKTAIKNRLAALGAAGDGTPEKIKHTKALAVDATFLEKSELIREAMLEVPDLTKHAAAEVAEEYYNEQTSDREATKKAALYSIADDDPRDAPVLMAGKDDSPNKKVQGWEGPAVPDMPTNIADDPDSKPEVE